MAPTAIADPSEAEVLADFQAAPLLPDPSQLRLDHISALLFFLLEGPSRSAAIILLTPGRSLEEAAVIWSAWEPCFRPPPPPPTHHLSAENAARDSITT